MMIYGTLKRTNRQKKHPSHRKLAENDSILVVTGPRILIASEDSALRSNLALALQKDGYDVNETRCTGDIVRYFSSKSSLQPVLEPIEALVLDISHNHWEGLALFKAIRQKDWALPVIVIHDSQDKNLIQEIKRTGASAILAKQGSIDPAHLSQEIMNVSPYILAVA